MKNEPTQVSQIAAREIKSVAEINASDDSILAETEQEKPFRNDGICPECFAELVHQEGMASCPLGCYYEWD